MGTETFAVKNKNIQKTPIEKKHKLHLNKWKYQSCHSEDKRGLKLHRLPPKEV